MILHELPTTIPIQNENYANRFLNLVTDLTANLLVNDTVCNVYIYNIKNTRRHS